MCFSFTLLYYTISCPIKNLMEYKYILAQPRFQYIIVSLNGSTDNHSTLGATLPIFM